MFGNFINRADAARVVRRIRDGGLARVASSMSSSETARVVHAWSDTAPPPRQWWEIAAVRRRWNALVSGDPAEDFPAWATRNFLRGDGGRGLSVGCGMGGRELRWAELGAFERIDAYDISPSQVEVARERARERGLDHIVHFDVMDLTSLAVEPGSFDAVIAEHSLHHLAPMTDVVAQFARALRPGGWFLVDEYVGPSVFQWTDRQLEAANAMLALLPLRYRQVPGQGVRRQVVRPSRLWMRLHDPSEAADSAAIMPSLRGTFDVRAERGYGGAVLHLALTDIAHNFLDGRPETEALLERCFGFEDDLMATGEVSSDFAVAVCQKRAS
jgi:SAM-dependent methyltransferase